MIQVPQIGSFFKQTPSSSDSNSTCGSAIAAPLFQWLALPGQFAMRAENADDSSTLARNLDDAKRKRQREFELGRECARRAMQEIGATGEVLVNADRSPAWPDGVTGSISHSSKTVWAAAASKETTLSIGIDTEPFIESKVIASIKKQIVSNQEWEKAKTKLPQLSDIEIFTALFSAKEAFYKCVYQVTQKYFNFRDAEANFVSDREVLIRTCLSKSGASSDEKVSNEMSLRVYFEFVDNSVFSIAWIEAGELAWI